MFLKGKPVGITSKIQVYLELKKNPNHSVGKFLDNKNCLGVG